MQYAGLAVYIVAEAIIFIPLLYVAIYFSSPDVLPNAALITAMLFAGLTVYALTTRKDFSFLGGILTIGGFVALGRRGTFRIQPRTCIFRRDGAACFRSDTVRHI